MLFLLGNPLQPIIDPLTELLKVLTGALHSYGLAIIVFTILVRAVLTPLTMRQLKSSKKMAALGPRIKEIQQKYKGDREALTKAQLALYKEEGVNPASGCLPLVVQMPILYALFFIFRGLANTSKTAAATAIYHAHFLWFTLDKPDHTYILPILAGATQWVQQRMMMQPVSDPQQRTTQQIMQFMPFMIVIFAINYFSGLALYWVTSTMFMIVVQYFITGWGQLFSNPLKIPDVATAPGVTATSRKTSTTATTTRPAPRGNGRKPEAGTSAAPVEDGRATAAGDRSESDGEDNARMGKMQRAAMRSTTSRARPRPRRK